MNSGVENLLKRFPPFDSSWSDEVKERWLQSFEVLLDLLQTEKPTISNERERMRQQNDNSE